MKLNLKLFKNNKMIYHTYSTSPSRIFYIIRTLPFQKAYFKCSYGNGHYNDGEFDLSDLKWAFSTFLEKDLVNTLQGSSL